MTDPISPAGPPAEISHLVRERTEARARRDWSRADALKAEIEAAGWRLVDRGNRTSVSPAAPPSVEVGGEIRYGSAAAVPSLLGAPVTHAWTVVVLASEEPGRTSRFLAALREHAPADTQVVIVANDPSDAQVAALGSETPDRAPIAGIVPELLRTSTRLGYAAAVNIGLRRAAGEFVLLADATAWPTGDALAPLAAALQSYGIADASLTYLWRIVSHGADASQLGGPIRIAGVAKSAASHGFYQLAWLIAVISVSIGLINLFPIPLLDGGHLLYYACEGILGRPLTERTQDVGFRLGLALVLGLMIFATWNDLVR